MTPHLTAETLAQYRAGTLSVEALMDAEAHLALCATCRDTLFAVVTTDPHTFTRHLLPSRHEFLCPEEELLVRYVDGMADETDREMMEAHLDTCSRCREDVANLRAFRAQMQGYNWQEAEAGEGAWERFQQRVATGLGLEGGWGAAARNLLRYWQSVSLTTRLVGAVLLGAITGWVFGEKTAELQIVSDTLLSLLSALATPIVFIAIIHALLRANIDGRTARRLVGLLFSNTLVAVGIGLVVANLLHPGQGANLPHPALNTPPGQNLIRHLPSSLFQPLTENNVLPAVLLAAGIGMALRAVRREQIAEGREGYHYVEEILDTLFRCLTVMLRWVITFIPLGVFALVAGLVGERSFATLRSLGGFATASLLALGLQMGYYLVRLRFGSWVRPSLFLRSCKSAFLTAFSTASSFATLPVTYACVRDKIGLRRSSSSLGVLVGTQVNRDGTALHETMAPLFIAQAIGTPIPLARQLTLACMAVLASVGAPGLPEAGLVTMLMVFRSMGLPTEYILLLLTIDWFLDRCRTLVNVMGHASVACLLDGKERKA